MIRVVRYSFTTQFTNIGQTMRTFTQSTKRGVQFENDSHLKFKMTVAILQIIILVKISCSMMQNKITFIVVISTFLVLTKTKCKYSFSSIIKKLK